MESQSKLVAHGGAHYVSREQLAMIPAPDVTPSWRPVRHSELVATIENELSRRGFDVTRESFAVSEDGARLFGLLDLGNSSDPSYSRSVGFRHANDKTMVIQIVAGVRVFVCDNMALSGSATILRHKHTVAFSLAGQIRYGLNSYLTDATRFESSIRVAQDTSVDGQKAKAIFFDMFYRKVLPVAMVEKAAKNFFYADERDFEDCKPRTVWAIHNATTRALKEASPFNAIEKTQALSRFLLN